MDDLNILNDLDKYPVAACYEWFYIGLSSNLKHYSVAACLGSLAKISLKY